MKVSHLTLILFCAEYQKMINKRLERKLKVCVSGKGEMWQRSNDEVVVELKEGVALMIPNGNYFQFHSTGTEWLRILLRTMPSWRGGDEAVFVEGHSK